MLRKTLALVALALAIPTIALAAKPTTHTSQSKAAPKVMYILKGTLSGFTAASAATTGSITINVTHSNFHARALVGHPFTLAVAANTATTLNGTTINDGTRGIVKFRAPFNVSNATLTAALTSSTAPMTAFQVIAH